MKTSKTSTPLQDERFLLLETLGHGAMGSVYRAYDRAEQRLVALKVPLDFEPLGPGHSLSAEFDTWHRLRHRNIVRAYELAVARRGPIRSETPYLVLEHVEGGPVHRMLPAGRVDDALAEAVTTQVLLALDRVHAAGYVHRDLKPANVLLAPTGNGAPRVRLTDFGLATPAGSRREPGVFSGSLPFVAPEALTGRALDGRADLYALGILLHLLTAGSLPCPSDDPREILAWHLAGPPADPRASRNGVSARLARFVMRLTARDPDHRPGSAREALELLGTARAASARESSRRLARTERASLRLALDAARLGAARRFRLPPDPDAREALLLEVSIWTQVRGLVLHRIAADARGMARLVLRLALERGPRGAARLRRHALSRCLPLDWLGDLPILAPRPVGGPSDAHDEAWLRGSARNVGRFLWRCARERPLVLSLETRAVSDPLGREVGRMLDESIGRSRGFARRQGGLLLLTTAET